MIDLMMALATATAPAPIAPSGRWVVDYQKDMCIVSRPFGQGDSNTMFAIKPSVSMDDNAQTLFFVAPNVGDNGVRRGQAIVTLGPSGEQMKVSYVSTVPKGTKVRGYEMYADAELTARLAQATAVSMKAGSTELSFATGKIEPVLKALRTCNESLFRSWGVDPAAMAKARDGVNPADWFMPGDYPAAALRRGTQGRSVIAVTVSNQGLATACRVVIKSDPDLDAQSCRSAMRKGRFETSSGTTDRYAILAVIWLLFDS
ncbi:MAG: energy transducer TonB [Sphingomonas sp.]